MYRYPCTAMNRPNSSASDSASSSLSTSASPPAAGRPRAVAEQRAVERRRQEAVLGPQQDAQEHRQEIAVAGRALPDIGGPLGPQIAVEKDVGAAEAPLQRGQAAERAGEAEHRNLAAPAGVAQQQPDISVLLRAQLAGEAA